MNGTWRYFYIPEECVKDVTAKANADLKIFHEQVSEFLRKAGTDLAREGRSGRMSEIAFEIDQPIPKGWRRIGPDYHKGKEVNLVVSDLRTKEGKEFKKEMEAINKNAIPSHAAINAVADKYGLRKEMALQEDRFLSFGGSYCPHVKAYLLAIPASGDGGLTPDYVVSKEITEITESQYIAITKENATLR